MKQIDSHTSNNVTKILVGNKWDKPEKQITL